MVIKWVEFGTELVRIRLRMDRDWIGLEIDWD